MRIVSVCSVLIHRLFDYEHIVLLYKAIEYLLLLESRTFTDS